jgi:glycosyltransferase involved in cell wall biosynthesis
MKQDIQNWLSLADLENLLYVSGFDTIKKTRKVLLPIYIPLVSEFFNVILANLPLLRKACLMDFIIARPEPEVNTSKPSASVVIACRNEKGNIQELIDRLPEFSSHLEIVFVDGRSEDGTREEIERLQKLYTHRDIKLYDQLDSRGKGNAVRIGFEKAKGDIFIILDADISVAFEDMLKFYDMLVCRRGEFINGTRMVYQMERQAMRFLNILGNKFFSIAFTYLLGQPIKDTLCGTKAIYKKDYEKLARNRAYFGNFDPFGDFDLLFGAAKLNLKIVEVPVRYYERRYGTTKIHRFRHGFLLLGMCSIAMRKIKFN